MLSISGNDKQKKRIFACGYTDPGLRTEQNQDAVFYHIGERLSIFCVADGMGGHSRGEYASGKIVFGLKEWELLKDRVPDDCTLDVVADALEALITKVNRQIYEHSQRNEICGSTIAILLILDDCYAVYSAGDSRVYRKKGFRFRQITSDDVWENRAEFFADKEQEAELQNDNYGKLTKAVGAREQLTLNRVCGSLKRGDLFLLCSDGVYKYADRRLFSRMLKRTVLQTKKTRLAKMLELIRTDVEANNAPDNHSAILVRAE